jgi:hypothetical protein
MEKYGRAGDATNDNINTTQAFNMLHNKGYKHTLRICNAYCFYTAIVVTRTRLSVTLYVRTLPIFLFMVALTKLFSSDCTE